MGVINPLDPEVETAEQVKRRPRHRGQVHPHGALGATDDCGFSPFSRDVKPKHGSPDFARDVAMQKIQARLEGARMASEELGCQSEMADSTPSGPRHDASTAAAEPTI